MILATAIVTPQQVAQVSNGDVRNQVHKLIAMAFGESNWPKAEYIIDQESHFNPFAVNPHSGACGLGQAYPCAKMGCQLSDVSCQGNWLVGYFQGHYGGNIDAAYQHKLTTGWY